VVQEATGAWWQDDDAVDLDQHLVHVKLPGRAGTLELQQLVGQLAGQALDSARPLWQITCREFSRRARARPAHSPLHCRWHRIGRVTLGMATTDPDAQVAHPVHRKESAAASSTI